MKKKIYVISLITLICFIMSSCSSLIPPLELPGFNDETSDRAVASADTTTPITEQSTVLVTDETTATFITESDTDDKAESGAESNNGTTSAESESINTNQGITEIPITRNYYASDDGYKALAGFEHASDMQLLYERLAKLAKEIHYSKDIDVYSLEGSNGESIENVIGSVKYPSTLTNEELFLTFNMFRADYPLFYWIDNQIIFSSKSLYLMTVEDYAYGITRAEYSRIIEDEIQSYLLAVKSERTNYRKALYFHDTIILGMDYTENPDGSVPVELKYHNLYGAFIGGSGVCEAYAKAFQVLLNASGIDNRYVIGVSGNNIASGIGHVWNMIQLGDGKWYYCDLTWDDLGDEGDGVQHNNFCVGEDTNISWGDDGYIYEPIKFDTEHIENLPTGTGEDYLYALPTAERSVYNDGSDEMLRTIITVKGFVFMIDGYNTLTTLQISKGGNVEFPAVTIGTNCYYATSIVNAKNMCDGFGEIEDYVMFVNPETESVILPFSMKYVDESVFADPACPKISVEPENNYIYYDKASETIKKK